MSKRDHARLTLAEDCRGLWKVWVQTTRGEWPLAMGYGWRTKRGAMNAALRVYPRGVWMGGVE